jgi:hypothetical protein
MFSSGGSGGRSGGGGGTGDTAAAPSPPSPHGGDGGAPPPASSSSAASCPATCSSTALAQRLDSVLARRRVKRKPDFGLRLTDAAHFAAALAEHDAYAAYYARVRAAE